MTAHYLTIACSKVWIKRSQIIKKWGWKRLQHAIYFPLPLLCLSYVNCTNVFLHWCFFNLSMKIPWSPEISHSSDSLPVPFMQVLPSIYSESFFLLLSSFIPSLIPHGYGKQINRLSLQQPFAYCQTQYSAQWWTEAQEQSFLVLGFFCEADLCWEAKQKTLWMQEFTV